MMDEEWVKDIENRAPKNFKEVILLLSEGPTSTAIISERLEIHVDEAQECLDFAFKEGLVE